MRQRGAVRKTIVTRWLAALPALAAGALAAQDPALPPLTVTASRPAPDLSTVVAEEIEASYTPALTELLRLVPGVHVDRVGATGGVSSLYLRGADPNYTAVFIDGVKVNDPTNTRGGSFDLSTLTREDVARIEVQRGPVSARHGADALAGAVNIVSTRGAGAPRIVAGLGGGEHGYAHGRAALRGLDGRFDYALGAATTDSGTGVPGSSARLGAANGNFGWAPDAASELRATVRYADADLESFPEDSGGDRYAERRETERRGVEQWLGSVAYRHLFSRGVATALTLGLQRRHEDIVSPGVAPGVRDPFGIPASRSANRFERIDGAWTLTGRVLATTLGGGVQGTRERGASDAELEFIGPADFTLARDTAAVFLDVEPTLPAGLRLEASVRIDDPQGYGAVTTPRARLSRPFGAYVVAASGGRGFKLPSFFALAHPIVGNPDLRPEKSTGYELGVTRESRLATASVSVFHARYVDAIDFDEGPPPRLVNRDRVVAMGGELGLRWDFGARGHLRLHAAYADTEIEGSDEPLRNRPRWTGGAQVRLSPVSPVDYVLAVTHVGSNMDSSIPTGDRELPAYTRVDLGSGWAPAMGFGVHLDIENLFNQRYDELIGFPGPSRNVRLNLRMNL